MVRPAAKPESSAGHELRASPLAACFVLVFNLSCGQACFNKVPLDFVGKQSFRWGGVGGKQVRARVSPHTRAQPPHARTAHTRAHSPHARTAHTRAHSPHTRAQPPHARTHRMCTTHRSRIEPSQFNRWRQIWFNGTYTTEGTFPEGSMWAQNPVPGGPVQPLSRLGISTRILGRTTRDAVRNKER